MNKDVAEEKVVNKDTEKMVDVINAPEKEVEKQKEVTMTYKNYDYNIGSNILINRKQRRHGRRGL